tara:strand:- start:898 stop:1005 length:108 start_codon:yes stop_codon:yes gene_type:complete
MFDLIIPFIFAAKSILGERAPAGGEVAGLSSTLLL